tara:strand:+ start:524 stop:688 length:165 start_codon:yes stop_codon:yes gene_type:complete
VENNLDIDIEPEKVTIEADGSKVTVSGILSKKHALILVSLILAILGIKEFDIPV